jgi:hypothetical protein
MVAAMGEKKRRGLIEQTRMRAMEMRNGVYVPRVEGDQKSARWPVCAKCHRDVDRVNVEDVGKHRVTIRAWCHDDEAVMVLEFPFTITQRDDELTWRHINTAINSCTFFEASIAL